jgi:hypothetical protein
VKRTDLLCIVSQTIICANETKNIYIEPRLGSQDGLVSIVTVLWAGGPGFISRYEIFLTASRPTLGPTEPPIQFYQRLFPSEKSGRGLKLTNHLHRVPRLRMREAIPPLPHTSS